MKSLLKKFRSRFHNDINARLDKMEAAINKKIDSSNKYLETAIDAKFDEMDGTKSIPVLENDSLSPDMIEYVVESCSDIESNYKYYNVVDSKHKHYHLSHAFNRITNMMNAKRNAADKMYRAYAIDRWFFDSYKPAKTELTPEQLKEIDDFWGRYSFCYKNNPESQRYFTAISGRFDPTYMPWGLFHGWLYRNHAASDGVIFFRDKNYLELVFPKVKQPKTVVRSMAGYYYNDKREIISKDEAVKICHNLLSSRNHEKLIIKPWEGGEGIDISFIRKGFSPEKIAEAFDSYNKNNKAANFICQEILSSHESWTVPGVPSLNLVRISTFSYGGKIYHTGTCFRMGSGSDSEYDHDGAGFLCARVDENGIIGDSAMLYKTSQILKTHPNGYEFAGKKLFNVDKAVAKAIELHYEVPKHRNLGWDFTVDESGEPVMIEVNGTTYLNQFLGDPMFVNAEICKKLLDQWILKEFYYDRANWTWNYREYYDHVEITRYGGINPEATIPQSIGGKKVTAIRDYSFTGGGKKKITVPATVKTIGEKAFAGSGDGCEIIKL